MGVTSNWCYPQGHHARRPPTTVPYDRPSSLKLDLNRRFFSLCDLEKKYGNSILRQALFIISNPSVNSNLSYSPETLNSGQNWWYLVPCDFGIWWMTLENDRVSLLYHIKLCASFHSHWRIQTRVTVRRRSIQVKISKFLSRVTLKFDGWPWKTKGHLS